MQIRCSACILTYNSEKTLRYTLESVKDFADIVVMDGGSADRTVDIAGEYGARIFPQQEGGTEGGIKDFTAVRKKLYAEAQEDWILCIDSDEYLDEAARQKIFEITSGGAKYKNILYRIKRKAIIGKKTINFAFFYPEFGKRLWNKHSEAKLKEGKVVHEDMVIGAEMAIEDLDIYMYHFWHENYDDLIKKDDYYLKLALQKNSPRPFPQRIRKSFINVLKAGNIIWKSIKIYIRHGFKNALPPAYVWRFVRYHLILAKKVLL